MNVQSQSILGNVSDLDNCELPYNSESTVVIEEMEYDLTSYRYCDDFTDDVWSDVFLKFDQIYDKTSKASSKANNAEILASQKWEEYHDD